MHKNLLLKAFEKAKKETDSNKVTHISNHLSDFILEDARETYGEKILRVNYNKITKHPNAKIHLKGHAVEALSHYLGYNNFADFLADNPVDNHLTNVQKTILVIKKNKFVLSITAIILIGLVIYTSATRQRWMIWQEDHYIEVNFDPEKYSINQLKLYKEDRIKYFKKVIVTCDTVFFNKDESVRFWYGKNKEKELEYFTALGLHPETGKTLKPITKYMINKYICVDSLKTLQK